MKTLKVPFRVIKGDYQQYPKYLTQILNIANQNSQATRAKYIGSMKDLFCEWSKSCDEACFSIDSWKSFYLKKKGEFVIQTAVKKIYDHTLRLLEGVYMSGVISPNLMNDIERWVQQLIFERTFIGMAAEMRCARALADYVGEEFTLSDSKGEKEGIDVFIGSRKIQIKPEKATYAPSLFFDKVKNHCILVTYRQENDMLVIFIREEEDEIETR